MSINTYLDLSTGHITDADREYLDDMAKNPADPEWKNYLDLKDAGGFRVVPHDYGWWISVPDLASLEVTDAAFRAGVIEAGLSEAFANVILYARQKGCFWINLDADGDEEEELEVFDSQIPA